MGGKILSRCSPFLVFLVLFFLTVSSYELRSQNLETRINGIQEDYNEILINVNGVSIDGLPGFLCIYGSNAIPILAGETGQPNIYHPIGAANYLGKGKIIGYTHDGFLSPESTPTSDKNQLILNSVNWTSSPSNENQGPIQVAVVTNENDTLIDFLISGGISTSQMTLDELQNLNDIENYNVVLIKEFFDESKVPILKEYVENGGGLVIALTSWAHYYFLDINGNFGSNFPPNQISASAGFIWRNEDGDCYAYPTSGDKTQFNSSSEYVKKVHVMNAWENIAEFLLTGIISEELDQNKLQYSSILEPALEFIPPQFSFITQDIYDYIRNYTNNSGRQPIPSEENPVVNETDKFDLQLFYAFNFVLQPQHVPVHPGSSLFPGEVINNSSSPQNEVQEHQVLITIQKPDWLIKNNQNEQIDDQDNEISEDFTFKKIPADYTFQTSNPRKSNPRAFLTNSMNTCEEKDYRHKINEEDIFFRERELKYKLEKEKKRILSRHNQNEDGKEGEEEELEMSTQLPQWFSSGLYAAPGQVVNISVIEPSEILTKYQILIGSHTDDISRHEKWFRSPRVVKKFPLENNQAVVASPYGGIIYIVIPQSELLKINGTQTIRLRISGAVKYPHFRLGETSVKEWRENIRYAAGPWAEFESENLVLTVRSSSASKVHDPEDLLLFWDQVMDAIADLSQIPRKRAKQERMAGDVQISAGFMHSGYPIMTFLAESDLSIDIETLRSEGSWGHFHELGHNHQNGAWTFGGTGEVTCNLFALYVLNTVCGIATPDTRPQMSPEEYKVTVANYIVNGMSFEQWKSEPFLALMTYVQLQRSYGWGAFKTVFSHYNSLSPEDQPETDEQKIDLWVITFSNVVHENLTPFFVSWGIPVSEEAANQINLLPESSLRIFHLLND